MRTASGHGDIERTADNSDVLDRENLVLVVVREAVPEAPRSAAQSNNRPLGTSHCCDGPALRLNVRIQATARGHEGLPQGLGDAQPAVLVRRDRRDGQDGDPLREQNAEVVEAAGRVVRGFLAIE